MRDASPGVNAAQFQQYCIFHKEESLPITPRTSVIGNPTWYLHSDAMYAYYGGAMSKRREPKPTLTPIC
jgi:hypothetical protein